MTSYKPENAEKRTESGLSLLQWLLLLAVIGVVVTVVASQFI